ncbi:hypothetical protein ACH4C6_07545 [Streptomyces sp. NPDC017943]|uniref:hypothetical protein n=1 Tax=Streptomyces sp. NPDC017943 TaxID=3365019 RepID=UPI00379B440B
MVNFQFVNPTDMLLVHQTGVQNTPDSFCTHGQPAVYLLLIGSHRSQPTKTERVNALVPRCALAEAIGSLQAQIRHQEGETALQAFHDEVTAHTEEKTAALEELARRQRDCCEAGFRTDGAEHTCGRNTTGADRE